MFDKIEDAIKDIKSGKLVIVVDDEDPENAGNFICAAETITPEVINFMATHGRGVICCPLVEERCEELGLELMVGRNTALKSTPFTISVDLIGNGCTTGISASDRAKTILALANPATNPESIGKPGHIFPLKTKKEGVLRRAGHTEAAIDLARLAGFEPAGALIAIMNEDGTISRLNDLVQVAKRFKLKLVSIKDLIKYRLTKESLITREIEVELPTEFGVFNTYAFTEKSNGKKHLALVRGNWKKDEPVLVRVHSSCVTGDILNSCRCDCGGQLQKAMELVNTAGKGVIVYMDQEGRGIGLINKLKAYKLQEQGLDTVEANLELGFKMDERDYGVGAQILRNLGVTKMRLISNNPRKRAGLTGYGLEIVEKVPIEIVPNEYNKNYLATKRDKLGHNILEK